MGKSGSRSWGKVGLLEEGPEIGKILEDKESVDGRNSRRRNENDGSQSDWDHKEPISGLD